jgi:uncharacterized integral membrane protein
MRVLRRRSNEEAPSAGTEEAGTEEEGLREWQPRLYLKLLLLLVTIAYVIAFAIENRKNVHVHFVLGTARVSLIWLILLSLALGLLAGVLLSQLYRRRRRRH